MKRESKIKIEKEIKKEEILIEETPKHHPLDLKRISTMVVTELTILYKAGTFLNKDLFKKLAKTLSHFILYRKYVNDNLALDEIRLKIRKLGNGKIHTEADYEHIFN